MRRSEQTISLRSGRIERPVARGGGEEWVVGIAQDAAEERDDGAATPRSSLAANLYAGWKHTATRAARTSISIAGSRYVPPDRRLPAAASTFPWSGPLSPSNTAIPSLLYGSRVEGLMHAL